MIETIYIARHGFRANWLNTKWTSPTGLAKDPPLAAHGEAQALELASYFESLPEDQRPNAIFSSPYYRCLQTAKPIAERLSLPIYVEHGLSEWYSPVAPGTGLYPRPKTAIELKAALPEIDPSWEAVDIDSAWRSVWLPPRKGEDVEGIHARMAGVLAHLVRQIETRPAAAVTSLRGRGGHEGAGRVRVLLVSHAATIIAMCRALVARPELPLRVGCCTLSQFSRTGCSDGLEAGDRWEAVSLASSVHLSDQTSLRDWGFEDIAIDDVTGKVVNDVGVPGTEDEMDDTFGPQIYPASML